MTVLAWIKLLFYSDIQSKLKALAYLCTSLSLLQRCAVLHPAVFLCMARWDMWGQVSEFHRLLRIQAWTWGRSCCYFIPQSLQKKTTNEERQHKQEKYEKTIIIPSLTWSNSWNFLPGGNIVASSSSSGKKGKGCIALLCSFQSK